MIITGAHNSNKEAGNPKNHALFPAEFVEQCRQQQSSKDVGECSQGQTKGYLRFRHSCHDRQVPTSSLYNSRAVP